MESKVSDDDQFSALHAIELFDERAVDLDYRNLHGQPIPAIEVHGTVAHQTGLVTDRTGKIGFATAGSTDDEEVFGTVKKRAVSELCDLRFDRITAFVLDALLQGCRLPQLAEP